MGRKKMSAGMPARPSICTPCVRATGGMIWVLTAWLAGPMSAPPKAVRAVKTISVQMGGMVDRPRRPMALTTPKPPTIISTRLGLRAVSRSISAPPTKAPMSPPMMLGGARTVKREMADLRPYSSASMNWARTPKMRSPGVATAVAMKVRRSVRTAHTVRHASPNDCGSLSWLATSSLAPMARRSMKPRTGSFRRKRVPIPTTVARAPPRRKTVRHPIQSRSSAPDRPSGRAAVDPTMLKMAKTLPRLSGG